jgi:ankyrin repeat protein
MTACFNGRTGNAERLLAHGANVNARDVDGRTALGFSMRMRKPETIRLLLARGADPNLACISDGTTPLMLAIGKEQFGGPMGDWAFSQDHLAIVVDLLKSGANVDAGDKSGETALMKAARTGKVEIITALLDRGAQPQLKNDQSQTSADIARAMGHKKAIEALLGKRPHEGPIKIQIEATPVSNEDLMKKIRDALEDNP